ncbi:hypothetical protein AVEN_21449-1 [Araneus ventricosus]|uniref:Uncharacterized protein n=1 Tax=Araneus ventricosus TaxID=182803 RepID=A0A4Y2VU29_ARAVE|nr:hypothetical protein AVEN_21449-1 [Araneus ventricosus]
MGLGVGNDSDELEEDHSQVLTTEELMGLHCVSQQEVVEETLSKEEGKVTAKQQSSGVIREKMKTWESAASYIEKQHPNKTVNMPATV